MASLCFACMQPIEAVESVCPPACCRISISWAGRPDAAASEFEMDLGEDGSLIIIGYTGTDAVIVVPQTIDGKTTSSIPYIIR